MNTDVKLTIDGIPVSAPPDYTVLEAARLIGIEIPSLCYLKGINEIGLCRICVVEAEGVRNLVASCVYPVAEGLVVRTNTERIRRIRKMTLELIMSNHRTECLICTRNPQCELQRLANDLKVDRTRYEGVVEEPQPQIDDSAVHLIRDNSKCVLCRRCVAVCEKKQSVAVIGVLDRGFDTHVSCAFDRNLDETPCVYCGQCITACPTGALTDNDSTETIWEALADPGKHVVAGIAPAVRVALGECFGLPVGTNVEGKMVTALRRLGFDGVFDICTAADITVLEEGAEFIDRFKRGGVLPLITSCSPGWVKFCQQFYPEFIPNLSTCKSPQQMFGAIIKSYYANLKGIDNKDVFVVSIMPCTAKKHEIRRDGRQTYDLYDVDATVTTRGLAHMISRAGLMFNELDESAFDPPFGVSTGAGVIFGATGGVMEAALRTVCEVMTGEPLPNVELESIRGMDGVKEAEYMIDGKAVRVAACSGLSNARKLLDSIKAGESKYDFIEIMCCPGGCIGGGGQPVPPSVVRNFSNLLENRAKALYALDKDKSVRKSHENPVVKKIYDDFLGKPGGHLSHKLLHTSYKAGTKYSAMLESADD